MYSIYQNRYANKLHLNIIRVKYSNEHKIIERDFAIKVDDKYANISNDLITYKLYLYLAHLLSRNALNDNVLVFDTKDLLWALKTTKKAYIMSSLEYLKAISFNYYYFKGKRNNKGYTKEIRTCHIIEDYSTNKGVISIRFDKEYLTLLGYSRLVLGIPSELLDINIRKYQHSLYIAFRILLHRQINYGKKLQDIISVKEIVKYCPTLPCYDELNKSKQVSRSIFEPFNKSMEQVGNILNLELEYEKPITTYNSFINNKIIIR